MQHESLEGAVAIVTGAAGGIGQAICQQLAESGVQIVAVDRNEQIRDLVTSRMAFGPKAQPVVADITQPAEVEAYIANALATFGRLDILINNAGIEGQVAPLQEYDEDVFESVMQVNVMGTFLNLKYGMSRMLAAGHGSIVNVASVAAIRGRVGLGAYVASKHAVLGLTRVAAVEAAGHGVRVNAVLPGPTDTRMIKSITSMQRERVDMANARTTTPTPEGRYGTVEEIAAVVGFLASPAATYVNGAAWVVDGAGTVG